MKRRAKLTPAENGEVLGIIGQWNVRGATVAVVTVVVFLLLPKGWPEAALFIASMAVACSLFLFGTYRGLTRLRELRLMAERREREASQAG